jgi:hypothetical protein
MAGRYIIAVDPGKTSGIMAYDPQENRVDVHDEMLQAELEDKVTYLLGSKTLSHSRVDVVVEKFVILPNRMNAGPWSQQIIGVIQYLCRRFEKAHMHLQMQGAVKSQITSQLLRDIGWWYRGGKGDANMAARHMLYFCTKNALIDDSKIARMVLDNQ